MNQQRLFPTAVTGSNLGQGENASRTSFLDKSLARILQALHVDFTKPLGTALGQILSRPSISIVSLGELSAEDHLRQTEEPTYSIGFSAQQLNAGVIECSRKFAAILVDQLLGCNGELIRLNRPLSEIEIELLHDSITPLISTYAGAWSKHVPFQLKNEGAPKEYLTGEPLFVASYQVRTSEGAGECKVILRLPSWRDTLMQLNQPKREKPITASENNGLLDTIGDCMLSARALLGSTHISVKDLLGLRVGDIICLDRDPEAPLEIRVSNRPKLLGKVRVERGQYIITIEGGMTRGGSDGSK